MKSIALYCRVSTDEQAQHGYSIDNQKERLAAYCVSQGWGDYRFYVDDGYTGTNTNRPALQRMIRHIHEGKIQTVIVYKLDRLGRKQKDVLHLLEDVFDKNEVTFKSATEPFDTSTSLGKAMLGILAVFAQLERDTIIERMTTGRRQRISRGIWYGGRVPFGYKWHKETLKLEIVPEEASLVRDIYNQCLKGIPYYTIAEWISKRSKSRFFDHTTIKNILTRPVYMGKLNNAGKLVDGNFDAIIEEETWQMVQRAMNERLDNNSIAHGDYLLSGLLECGVCGAPVIHLIKRYESKGKRYFYYGCKTKNVRRKGTKTCPLEFRRRDELDSWVINRLKQLALDPNETESMINSLKISETDNDDLIEELNARLNEIEDKINNLYDAIQNGLPFTNQLRERIKSFEEEKEAILLRIDEIEDVPKEDRSEYLVGTLKEIGLNWEYMDYDEQRAIIRDAITKIILRPKQEPEIIWNL